MKQGADPVDAALRDLSEATVSAARARAQAVDRARAALAESLTATLRRPVAEADSTPSGDHVLSTLRDLAECRDIVEEAIAQFTDLAIDVDGTTARKVGETLGVAQTTVSRQRAKRTASAD